MIVSVSFNFNELEWGVVRGKERKFAQGIICHKFVVILTQPYMHVENLLRNVLRNRESEMITIAEAHLRIEGKLWASVFDVLAQFFYLTFMEFIWSYVSVTEC
jgi:hypothetical protein